MKSKHTIASLLLCFLFTAVLFIGCNKKDDNLYQLQNKYSTQITDVIRFDSVSSYVVDADTISQTLIHVAINPEAENQKRKVIFTTTLGVFENGMNIDTVTADAFGKSLIKLSSKTIGTAKVSAMVDNVVVQTEIDFIPALPDDMILTADHNVVDSDSAIQITASLSRNITRGIVSDPVKVFFSITPDTFSNIGFIIPAFANSINGNSNAVITNPLKHTGKYVVTAKVFLKENSDSIVKSIPILIR